MKKCGLGLGWPTVKRLYHSCCTQQLGTAKGESTDYHVGRDEIHA